jgi:hypothetical protein
MAALIVVAAHSGYNAYFSKPLASINICYSVNF